MNKLHDLMAKLQSIEEAAKTSDIPAVQRKAKNPQDWKVSMKDLEAEEKEGKISHKDNLAKNSGKTNETVQDPISDAAPQNSEVHDDKMQGGAGAADESIEECGDMEPAGGKVSMSMQDLLALMTHLQKGEVGRHDEPLMGDEEEEYAAEEYGNSVQGGSDEYTMPVASVTNPPSNDMFTKNKEAPKVNGGGNPMQEALAELYAEIKARPVQEAKKAKKDYDKDGKIETGSEEHAGAVDNAIKKSTALSLKEANQMARKLRK